MYSHRYINRRNSRKNVRYLTGYRWLTCNKGVTSVTRKTRARGWVINHITDCISSAHSNAGVGTFVIHTCIAPRTVRIENALRPTACVGVPEIFWQTRTGSCSILFPTYSIWPTWWWITRVSVRFNLWFFDYKKLNLNIKWGTDISLDNSKPT